MLYLSIQVILFFSSFFSLFPSKCSFRSVTCIHTYIYTYIRTVGAFNSRKSWRWYDQPCLWTIPRWLGAPNTRQWPQVCPVVSQLKRLLLVVSQLNFLFFFISTGGKGNMRIRVTHVQKWVSRVANNFIFD